ncbi:MAG TPA: tetratricopeptide repeat protein, partial [Wenzhouxiangella sp.]
ASFLEDWDQAIEHYTEAIEIYQTLGYVSDQISVLANLGPSYRANGEPQKALQVYLEGIEALGDLDSPDLSAQFQMNLGNLYVDLGQVDEALQALGQSMVICEQQGFSFCVMLNHLNMGYAHYINQDYANALAAYDLAGEALERLPDPYVERQLMDNYADLYKDLGDYEQALSYADRYHALDRQLINEESKVAAEEIQTRYETELKDAELLIQAEQIQRQQAQLRFGVIAAAGLVLALAVVIFFLSFRAKTLQSLYERNQDLLTQNEVNQRLAEQRMLAEPMAVENDETTESASQSLAQVFDRVTDALQREAIYRDPNLSLNDLASHVASNSTYVSNAISQVANTNFNNLVNYYRIMDARRQLNQLGPEAQIASLVHHCGFNSKASFYRAFSKYVGMTPSQYIQRLKASGSNAA